MKRKRKRGEDLQPGSNNIFKTWFIFSKQLLKAYKYYGFRFNTKLEKGEEGFYKTIRANFKIDFTQIILVWQKPAWRRSAHPPSTSVPLNQPIFYTRTIALEVDLADSVLDLAAKELAMLEFKEERWPLASRHGGGSRGRAGRQRYVDSYASDIALTFWRDDSPMLTTRWSGGDAV
jgi:hypothetical protein